MVWTNFLNNMKFNLFKLTIIAFFLFTHWPVCYAQPGTQSDFIKIDQFGYKTDAEKVAVLSNPEIGFNAAESYSPGSILEVRSSDTDALVFSALIQQWNGGAIQTQSGDLGWWFDFSSVQTTGSYYVYDPINDFSSYEFDIQDDIYSPILEAAGRMFYYNRCGMAKATPFAEANWVDGTNFTQDQNARYVDDPNNVSLYRDVSGGWFDAGDYNKYVNYSNNTIHDLLWAYQQAPDVFSDNWNIPESGNNVPDILDEIKWELDWLLKMVNPDGTVHMKVGSIDFSENENSPPSANVDPRYYGPTCSSAEIVTAGMFAHAAIIYGQISGMESYAANLQTQAENIWQQVLVRLNNNTLEINCDQALTSSDSDEDADQQRSDAYSAAIYLFALTNTSSYGNYILNNTEDSGPLEIGAWDNYHLPEIDALLYYTTLPNADATLSQEIISGLSNDINNNWNTYYGWTEDDLYRSYIPDWSYHWGSNSPKAAFGVLNYVIDEYNVNTSLDFVKRQKETLHYFHGVNPLNKCYLSNMSSYGAENSVQELYHTWFFDGTVWDNASSELGPAPGFVAGGPNQTYAANTSLSPPYNQPAQKSYLDFNTSWPDNSWEITEPAIYYNAIYLRLLSQMVTLPQGGITLDLKAILQGPYDEDSQLMNDNLRANNEIPLTEPFTALGFNHVNGGGETTTQPVLDIVGNDAIVDWIFVELRDGVSPNTILATQAALLQRDGDVVDLDGTSLLEISGVDVEDVFVILRHRNHFGVKSLNALSTDQNIVIDFSNPTTEVYGMQPMIDIGGVKAMIAGDANNDGQVNAVDKNNYWRVENAMPFDYINTKADFNLDGIVNPVDKNGYWRVNNSKIEQLD